MSIPNVLSHRYVSPEMEAIFDPVHRIAVERRFWIAVLAAQIEVGLDVDPGVLDDYLAVVDDIDEASIHRREIETRHDVKARLDEFSALAGHQHLHKGLTSRDVTENVEQMLTSQALEMVANRCAALLTRLAGLAVEYADVVVVGRTHNVPAQPTTVGKRFAQFGEELLFAYDHLRNLQERLPFRGIKGPVGSQQDQVDLLGSNDAARQLDNELANRLGAKRLLSAVGQVYPRSVDFEVVTVLAQIAAGPSNLALLIRHMAGLDLATEGFAPGQVGSSAMPHKMNTRSCERINGLANVLQGYVTMTGSLSGDQWNEGDVSCSVVRRVALPDAFFAIDGVLETTFSVLNGFGVFPAAAEAELRKYLPFVATPSILMEAVRRGMGREEAHEIIKEHAVATALEMRAGKADGQQLFERLGLDDRIPIQTDEIRKLGMNPESLLGRIDEQVSEFVASVEKRVEMLEPSVVTYTGGAVI